MAVDTHPARTARPGAFQSGRGRPQVVTIRRTVLIAGLLEGIALADETLTAAERIQTAAAVGSRSLVVHIAGRLGVRATAAKAEFRRLAGEAEE